MHLEDFGFSTFLAKALESIDGEVEPARVVMIRGDQLRVVTESGEESVQTSGRLRHEMSSPTDFPAIGDWVALREGRIEKILPRRTKLSRKVAGRRTREQVVAANVDTVLIVMGLDADFSERRLERYLTTVWASGAQPAIVLNKADLDPASDAACSDIRELAGDVPVVAASCKEGRGLDQIRALLHPRQTTVLVGSSGVGKSTLINVLLDGELQITGEVSPRDDRGQHTTTHRELFVLPGGALLIDNPGIRELQLWADEDALSQSFDDISQLAIDCRYRDCAHADEPGCAVRSAVEAGILRPERLESLRSLQRELEYLERRQDESADRMEKHKWRAIHREMRKSGRHRGT